MLVFSIVVLMLRMIGVILKTVGVKLEKQEEPIKQNKFASFVAGSLIITAYVYILLQFIKLK